MMLTNLLSGTVRSVGLTAVMRAVGVATRLLPIPQPTMLVGPGASARLGQAICDFDHTRVLVVTDPVVARLGLMAPLLAALKAGGTAYVVFDKMLPDAPVALIEQGVALFKRKGCDAVIAFGGGSAMDAAKAIALAAANNKHPAQLAGYFKGLRTPVPIYAVPTTAGTGSEVTVAAVISDPETQRKLVIADTRIVPRMAALDPNLMLGLPPDITAATGMDALTHAIEAYVSTAANPITDACAIKAIELISANLRLAVRDGSDMAARENMAYAQFLAGMAFNNASLGFVHAMAHQLGGLYDLPHGVCNAVLLPHVQSFNASVSAARLSDVGRALGVDNKHASPEEGAQAAIAAIRCLSQDVDIPAGLRELGAKLQDIPLLATNALKDACGLTNPRRADQRQIEEIFRSAF